MVWCGVIARQLVWATLNQMFSAMIYCNIWKKIVSNPTAWDGVPHESQYIPQILPESKCMNTKPREFSDIHTTVVRSWGQSTTSTLNQVWLPHLRPLCEQILGYQLPLSARLSPQTPLMCLPQTWSHQESKDFKVRHKWSSWILVSWFCWCVCSWLDTRRPSINHNGWPCHGLTTMST